MKYDVGIVGWWSNLNYGGVLTYYSLYKAIENMGYSVVMLKKTISDKESVNEETVPYRFSKNHYNISPQFYHNEVNNFNELCDAFVVGSDQLWNPKLIAYSGKQFFLSFATDHKKKISYSTSFGDTDHCDKEFIDRFGPFLHQFNKISVREDFAVDLLKNEFNIDAECVCDPIFLNGRKIFEELAKESQMECNDEYVLNFILDPNNEKIDACKYIREKNNIKNFKNFTNLMKAEEKDFYGEFVYRNAEIVDFVKAYQNAKMIVTDSFHGTCLAIILNKPFISIANKTRGAKRFVSMLNKVGLLERLVMNVSEIYENNALFSEIDYDHVNKNIVGMTKRGSRWLEKALKGIDNTVNDCRDVCTGCGACKVCCPVGAIHMECDSEGFWKPYIDSKKCIDCGLCKKKCIAVNPVYKNDIEPDCYAVMAEEEIRMKSSSGGMFTIAANYVLENGGYICGASYTDDFKVKHILIDDKSQLDKLRGSKYMQSEMGDIYIDVKHILDSGKMVLFTGMPCQVAGLYSYLQRDYDNLITMDLLCHGITSSKVFEKYHKEILDQKKLTRLEFKAKEPWGWHAGVNAYFEDGTRYSQPLEKDYYFIAYLKSISKNKSCGQCVCNKLPRQGDITIGDFWGINRNDPEMFDNKGTSVVLLNNEKGNNFFNTIYPYIYKVKKEALKNAIKGNQPIVSPFKMHKNRNTFFEKFDKMKFDILVEACRDDNVWEAENKEYLSMIPEVEHNLYFLAKIAAENSNGRKVVTWTANPAFNRILKKFFDIDVSFSIARNENIVDGINIKNVNDIDGKSKELYIVAIHQEYNKDVYGMLMKMGYSPLKDYVFRNHEPIVLENFNCADRYEDIYGNVIDGYNGIISKIILRGGNNHIKINENVKGLTNLYIDVNTNTNISIGKDVRISDSLHIESKGVSGISKLNIMNNCRLSNGLIRLYNNNNVSEILINEYCTFERNLELHANSGKKIIIGRDCMFSHDIDLWAGDGHSIFDVETGKNINSVYENLSKKNNELIIGEHVWISKGTFILHGTNIGDGCVVGAKSVVKGIYPNNCSIAGNPSKIIKRNIAWSREQVAYNIKSCGEKYVNMTHEDEGEKNEL